MDPKEALTRLGALTNNSEAWADEVQTSGCQSLMEPKLRLAAQDFTTIDSCEEGKF